MRNLPLATATLVAVCLLFPGTDAGAAGITIVNTDGPGEGFNDATAAVPVGGNPGTTVGEQRLNVFEYVATLWEAVISTNIEIYVKGSFDPLYCDSTITILGSAGAETHMKDFDGAPVAATWYPVALANKLAGKDLHKGGDIGATFNSELETTCPTPIPLYLGFDGNPPLGSVDFASVLLHEIGHGLGFATLVSSGGVKGAGTGNDDTYMLHLEDHATGELFPDMTDAERASAMVSPGNLHWNGDAVVTVASSVLSAGYDVPTGHVQMYAPSSYAQGSSTSHWDTALSPNQVMEPSYVGPNHNVGLMRELFQDIGWGTLDCGSGALDTAEECDDGNTNDGDGCNATCRIESLCAPAPQPGCRQPGAKGAQIQYKSDSAEKRYFKWKWSKGAVTTFSEFCEPGDGDGMADGKYHLCIYDSSGKAQPLSAMAVRPGGTCNGKDCWKAKDPTSCQFTDKFGLVRGVTQLKLKPGADTRASINAKGKGANVPEIDLSGGLALPVTVQMIPDDGSGLCWQATYDTANPNDGVTFKAKQ